MITSFQHVICKPTLILALWILNYCACNFEMFFINEIQGGPWVAQMQVKLFKVFILKGSHRSCAAHARRWWCLARVVLQPWQPRQRTGCWKSRILCFFPKKCMCILTTSRTLIIRLIKVCSGPKIGFQLS